VHLKENPWEICLARDLSWICAARVFICGQKCVVWIKVFKLASPYTWVKTSLFGEKSVALLMA